MKQRYQQKAKELTLQILLKLIANKKEFTGQAIAKEVGISIPRVNYYLDEFKSLGYIEEIGSIGLDMGRKSRLWQSTILKKTKSLACSIDHRQVRIALVSLEGQILASQATEVVVTPQSILPYLEKQVSSFLATLSDKERKGLLSMGISVPGDVSDDRKTLIFATNLHLRNVNFQSLEEKLGLTIYIENEANAALISQLFLVDKLEKQSILFFSISQLGLGGAIFMEGQLHKGINRKCGEIGHMSIDFKGKECSCGNRGCLERYVSDDALLKLIKDKTSCQSLEDLLKLPVEDKKPILAEYCYYLGRGMRNLVAITDVGQICISGQITNHWDDFYPLLMNEIFSHNYFYPNADNFSLSVAKYGSDASLVGVAFIPFLNLFYGNKSF